MKLALVLVLVTSAYAEPVQLELTHEPPPRHLHMRARTAAAPVAGTTTTATPMPRPPPEEPPADATLLRDVREPVSVRFNLGYTVDGTALTGQPTLGGRLPNQAGAPADFATVRAYGFGEGYLSTRGVGLESLSTYFAAKFQITSALPATGTPVTPPPIATWFDRSGVSVNQTWAEVSDFLPWHELAPLRVRAGALYVYGPWVMHMYGVTAAWEGKLIHAQLYGGSRVPDYTLGFMDQQLDRSFLTGFKLRTDLRDLPQQLPIVVGVEGLAFTRVGAGQTQPSNHGEVEVDWRPGRDLAVIAQARAIDGQAANEHVQLRSRYGEVTNIVVDLSHRHPTDWRWDPSLVGNEVSDPLAPKRYLDLGPVLGQFLISARAGTLIAENVDLYGRFAASSIEKGADTSAYAATYLEGGGALEVRLRRTIALGVTSVTRATERPTIIPVTDMPGTPQPLAIDTSSAATMGEKSFTELGLTLRMSLGARKFSALAEVFGRNTRYVHDYCLDTRCGSNVDTGVPDSTLREGGRFTIDAWIRDRVRLFASYELSSGLSFAPEISGYKSLKLIMEGVY